MIDDFKSLKAKYGSWKFINEISLADLMGNPVWVWCLQSDEDGIPENGDETSMRPLLESKNILTEHIDLPLILLKIIDTGYYARGLYNHEKKMLEAISVFTENNRVHPSKIVDLTVPVIYLSIPSIDGIKDIEFECSSLEIDEAYQLTR